MQIQRGSDKVADTTLQRQHCRDNVAAAKLQRQHCRDNVAETMLQRQCPCRQGAHAKDREQVSKGRIVGDSLLVGIISLQLLLQSQDLLIPFVQPPSQRNHDVALFQQQLLVPIHLQQMSEHTLRHIHYCLFENHS